MMIAEKTSTPEADLIVAIIMQAYRDLFILVKSKSGIAPIDRQQALSFLTDETGKHAAHRNSLCSLIGWDGDILAQRVRQMLEGEEFPVFPRDATPAVRERQRKAVVELRNEWRNRKNAHVPPSQSATNQLQLVALG